MRWPQVPHPWDLHPDYLGGVLVRFHLRNAKLYSYTFTLPDPTGQLELERQNARWCDHIRHRSDNWDRATNAPPQYRSAATFRCAHLRAAENQRSSICVTPYLH